MDEFDDSYVNPSQLANDAFQSNPVQHERKIGEVLWSHGVGRNGTVQQNMPHGPQMHGKIINDPIHGTFRLDPQCKLIFDTRQFQRLRRLKQLGVAYYVFPGASHNRFEHCLGVAHLAQRFASQLCSFQRAELDVDRTDIRVVELAGLCHDLGHGPFSHVFEREFLRRIGVHDWDHEDMSTQMLDYLVEDNYIDAISNDDLKRVKSYITSGHGSGAEEAKKPTLGGSSSGRWLGEIVANGRNGIDVDKFDYLARDAKYCGVNLSCNFNRIMQFSKVIDDEICYKYTEYMNLYELFHARAMMHRSVYTHKKAKAIEFMVVDALIEADKAFKFSERLWDPAKFVRLDDNVIDYVENFDFFDGITALVDEGAEVHIRSAQAIISRLRNRQLYKYVTDAPIPFEVLDRGHWEAPAPEEVISCYAGTEVKLKPEDVIIQENKINYSMKDSNPLDHVHFYDYIESKEKRKLRPEQISAMVVQNFEEKRLRVYSRNSDMKHVNALHEAFESWLKGRFGHQVIASTPSKTLKKERYQKLHASQFQGRRLFEHQKVEDDLEPVQKLQRK